MSSWIRGFRGQRACAALLALLVCLLAAPAFAEESATEPQLQNLATVLPSLLKGGYVIYMRHEQTELKEKPEAGDLDKCETQRNLSQAGRTEAAAIGRAVRGLSIPVGKVYSSPFCRCKDTASLAFGRYEALGDLHFALEASAEERQRLTGVLRTMLATPPAPGLNTVIVAHTANLREAAGLWPKPEGTAYVLRPLGGGRFEPVARILPAEWSAAAAASRH